MVGSILRGIASQVLLYTAVMKNISMKRALCTWPTIACKLHTNTIQYKYKLNLETYFFTSEMSLL